MSTTRPSPGHRLEERRGTERSEAQQCRSRLELAAVRAVGAGRRGPVRHRGLGARQQRAASLGARGPLDAAVPPLGLRKDPFSPPLAKLGAVPWTGPVPTASLEWDFPSVIQRSVVATLQVELVAVERKIWSGEANMVIARTTEG